MRQGIGQAMDIGRIRADTPAVARRAYMHNAGAALMPVPVVDAVKRHIDLEAEIGGYHAAAREHDRIEGVYGSVARLLTPPSTDPG
jgi:selenocysteine lyase/cysteine desulfurase